MLFCWKSVDILVVNSSSTLFFFSPTNQERKLKTLELSYSTVARDSIPDSQLKAAGSVGLEWARSGSWDAELKRFHVPFKMTSPDHLDSVSWCLEQQLTVMINQEPPAFPQLYKDEKLRNKCLIGRRDKDLQKEKSRHLCSDLFTQGCFKRDLQIKSPFQQKVHIQY